MGVNRRWVKTTCGHTLKHGQVASAEGECPKCVQRRNMKDMAQRNRLTPRR